MYQTNHTSRMNSSCIAKSYDAMQKDFWSDHDMEHCADQCIIDQVFSYYHDQLTSQPNIVQLLVQRKIDPKYIDHFRIGYADRTLGFQLSSPRTDLGSRNRGHLQRLGLLKDSGHEFFRGSLVMPYMGKDKQIKGAYGRRPHQQRRSPAYHLYWNPQETPLFNSADCFLSNSLILCKSPVDALTLLSADINNVAATMGIKGFNEVQLSQLLENNIQKVYVAFDNSPPANQYALLIAQLLDAVGIKCFRVLLPLGKDVNGFAKSESNILYAFDSLIQNAVPIKQGYEKILSSKIYTLNQFSTIENCITYYLEEQKQHGKADRTLKNTLIHLEKFYEYCFSRDIKCVLDITDTTLHEYQQYLSVEKNKFTGKVISVVTQRDRLNAVLQMLNKLHIYGVLADPLKMATDSELIH